MNGRGAVANLIADDGEHSPTKLIALAVVVVILLLWTVNIGLGTLGAIETETRIVSPAWGADGKIVRAAEYHRGPALFYYDARQIDGLLIAATGILIPQVLLLLGLKQKGANDVRKEQIKAETERVVSAGTGNGAATKDGTVTPPATT